MMPSIFSSFDPSLITTQPQILWYMYGLLPLFIFKSHFWATWTPQPLTPLSNMIINLSSSANSHHYLGFTSMMVPLFLSLSTLNILGILPFSITLTSHLLITVSFALPMWLSLLMASMLQSPLSSTAHFLPASSPMGISPFLSLIETLSSLIRPITLSFRLTANISAGHVILSMMSTFSSFCTPLFSPLSILLIISLNMAYSMFEILICMIQAYVFTLLLIMYTNDHITP